jgi:hypothetical protein
MIGLDDGATALAVLQEAVETTKSHKVQFLRGMMFFSTIREWYTGILTCAMM